MITGLLKAQNYLKTQQKAMIWIQIKKNIQLQTQFKRSNSDFALLLTQINQQTLSHRQSKNVLHSNPEGRLKPLGVLYDMIRIGKKAKILVDF